MKVIHKNIWIPIIMARRVQGGPKMAQFVLNTLTLSNINRFSKFFHCQKLRIRRKFVITLSLKIQPHLKCVATLPCGVRKSWFRLACQEWGRLALSSLSQGARSTGAKVNSKYYCQHVLAVAVTRHPCKMPALLLDPATGRRTVTHC